MPAVNSTSMKKIWATRLTDVSTTDKEGIGAIRFEGAKVYKYVRYNAGTAVLAAVAGDFTSYHGDDAYTSTLVDVTCDHSDGASIGAGVLQAVIPNLGFGWVQVEGVATLTTALTAGADGNALTVVGAGDRTLDVSALVTDFICAVALDASARIVLLKCPW